MCKIQIGRYRMVFWWLIVLESLEQFIFSVLSRFEWLYNQVPEGSSEHDERMTEWYRRLYTFFNAQATVWRAASRTEAAATPTPFAGPEWCRYLRGGGVASWPTPPSGRAGVGTSRSVSERDAAGWLPGGGRLGEVNPASTMTTIQQFWLQPRSRIESTQLWLKTNIGPE